jgi:hypothetical protein
MATSNKRLDEFDRATRLNAEEPVETKCREDLSEEVSHRQSIEEDTTNIENDECTEDTYKAARSQEASHALLSHHIPRCHQ